MTDSRTFRISRFEETSTQQALLSIARKLPPGSAYSRIREKESIKGADWRWDIWLAGRSRRLGVRVQAKRLYPDGTYAEIDHKVGKGKVPQIDILIDQCKADSLVPIYVFYNDDQADAVASSICLWSLGWPSMLGATYAQAQDVLPIVRSGKKGLADLASVCAPWGCMIRPWRGACCRDPEGVRMPPFPYFPLYPFPPKGTPDEWFPETNADLADSAARALGVYGEQAFLRDSLPTYAQHVLEGREDVDFAQWPPDVGMVTVLNQYPLV